MSSRTRHGSKPNRKPLGARLTAVLSYDKLAKVHVGYAPGLNIYSQAITKERAKRTLTSAVELFLTAAQKNPALAAAVHPEKDRSQVAKAGLIYPTSFDFVSVIPT